MLVLHCSAEYEGTSPDEAARRVKIAQVSAAQKRRIHVLITVMQLDGVLCQEMIRGPDIESASFAANGVANNLAIIGIA